jgi:glycosyltransferase involved in cell wall biosynthesis
LLFTGFTPVFNRRDLIHRVWQSLRAQTFRDFEWVIVDDGSTDNVAELIEQYTREADFPITFRSQPNGGKHIAWNQGVDLARGELFVSADSDDAFVPTALERFKFWWMSISAEQRQTLSGVNVLCQDPATGEVIGNPYPQSPMLSQNLELAHLHHMVGEKWGVVRTDLLRQIRFPEDAWLQRNYLSENYLWLRLARTHQVLCVNEPLRLYYRDAVNSIIHQAAAVSLVRRGLPTRYFYKSWHLNANLDYLRRDPKELAKTALDVWISGLAMGKSARSILKDARSGMPWIIRLVAAPAGYAALVYCRYKDRKIPRAIATAATPVAAAGPQAISHTAGSSDSPPPAPSAG